MNSLDLMISDSNLLEPLILSTEEKQKQMLVTFCLIHLRIIYSSDLRNTEMTGGK